jgi:hypothetical protein
MRDYFSSYRYEITENDGFVCKIGKRLINASEDIGCLNGRVYINRTNHLRTFNQEARVTELNILMTRVTIAFACVLAHSFTPLAICCLVKIAHHCYLGQLPINPPEDDSDDEIPVEPLFPTSVEPLMLPALPHAGEPPSTPSEEMYQAVDNAMKEAFSKVLVNKPEAKINAALSRIAKLPCFTDGETTDDPSTFPLVHAHPWILCMLRKYLTQERIELPLLHINVYYIGFIRTSVKTWTEQDFLTFIERIDSPLLSGNEQLFAFAKEKSLLEATETIDTIDSLLCEREGISLQIAQHFCLDHPLTKARTLQRNMELCYLYHKNCKEREPSLIRGTVQRPGIEKASLTKHMTDMLLQAAQEKNLQFLTEWLPHLKSLLPKNAANLLAIAQICLRYNQSEQKNLNTLEQCVHQIHTHLEPIYKADNPLDPLSEQCHKALSSIFEQLAAAEYTQELSFQRKADRQFQRRYNACASYLALPKVEIEMNTANDAALAQDLDEGDGANLPPDDQDPIPMQIPPGVDQALWEQTYLDIQFNNPHWTVAQIVAHRATLFA